MSRFILLFLFLVITASCNAQYSYEHVVKSEEPPNHRLFSDLLERHVLNDKVNYKSLQADSLKLNAYLNLLSAHPPNETWEQSEQLAYWINAYNAFTLKLIIDNYPLNSITDLHPLIHIPLVNTVWHKKFFSIGGEAMSLDYIEHKILRKQFNEPRIHFAINCASISCPPLRAEAFEAKKINFQLNEQAKLFINDPSRNQLDAHNPKLSKIFSWFSGDFKKELTLVQFINKYGLIKINEKANIDYMDYDWSLNDIANN